MHSSQFVAAVVIALSLLAALGSLAVLAVNGLQLTTVVVLGVVVLAVVGMSAVGARSRRWLSNPYW